MIKTLLKGLLLAFGGGLALGAGFKLGQHSAGRSAARSNATQIADLEKKVVALEVRIPEIVESKLAAGALESLVRAIQTAVVQRISSVESSLMQQSEAIASLREASSRTDQNLQKMLEGIEKLQERRARLSTDAPGQRGAEALIEASPDPETSNGARWRVPFVVSVSVVPFILLGLYASGVFPPRSHQALTTAPDPPIAGANDIRSLQALLSTRPRDETLLLKLGREYVVRKDWTRAEDAYRSVLRSNPRNREALLALSDALYQQQKYEESATVLSRLSAGNAP